MSWIGIYSNCMELELSIINCFGIGAFDESFDLFLDYLKDLYNEVQILE